MCISGHYDAVNPEQQDATGRLLDRFSSSICGWVIVQLVTWGLDSKTHHVRMFVGMLLLQTAPVACTGTSCGCCLTLWRCAGTGRWMSTTMRHRWVAGRAAGS